MFFSTAKIYRFRFIVDEFIKTGVANFVALHHIAVYMLTVLFTPDSMHEL